MRDFTLGIIVGMFVCAALFNYVFWLAERREEAMQFIKARVRGL
jgi:hypothetical protein